TALAAARRDVRLIELLLWHGRRGRNKQPVRVADLRCRKGRDDSHLVLQDQGGIEGRCRPVAADVAGQLLLRTQVALPHGGLQNISSIERANPTPAAAEHARTYLPVAGGERVEPELPARVRQSRAGSRTL